MNSVTELEEENQENDQENQETNVDNIVPFPPQFDQELESLKDKNFGEWLFYKVFFYDIHKILRLSDLWKSRAPPSPLLLSSLSSSTIETKTPNK